MYSVDSLVPSPAVFSGPAVFRGGPGIFSHMCYVKGRKDLIQRGSTGSWNSKKSLGTR